MPIIVSVTKALCDKIAGLYLFPIAIVEHFTDRIYDVCVHVLVKCECVTDIVLSDK